MYTPLPSLQKIIEKVVRLCTVLIYLILLVLKIWAFLAILAWRRGRGLNLPILDRLIANG